MPFEVQTEADIARIVAQAKATNTSQRPTVLNVADLLALKVSAPSMLIENILPTKKPKVRARAKACELARLLRGLVRVPSGA
jgi:hypothetical protein